MTYAPKSEINDAILSAGKKHFIQRAETELDYAKSCRSLPKNTGFYLFYGITTLYAFIVFFPGSILQYLMLFPLLLFIGTNITLKCAVFGIIFCTLIQQLLPGFMDIFYNLNRKTVHFFRLNKEAKSIPLTAPKPIDTRLPTISILVPLLREANIAPYLLERLYKIHYPRSLLKILLLVEEDDTLTLNALNADSLPHWVRILVIPQSKMKSKPRALNYALNLCDGEIIGVYDAEGAPEPDQLYAVARRFRLADPKVACLQGILDFYNSDENWLSRCFTIEYAAWFRVILPGLEKMGFPLPLAGTTFFVRRQALEAVGKWDAYNVTEDADLGIRLARAGYRSVTIDVITFEEANCYLIPWIRQRTRWLKGYIMTWLTHSKNPRPLLRELGWRQFLGLQIFFCSTLISQIVTPVLLLYWLLSFEVDTGALKISPIWTDQIIIGLLLLTSVLDFLIKIYGICAKGKTKLLLYFPLLYFYYLLSTIAFVRAVLQMISAPYFWEKTVHGFNLPKAGSHDGEDHKHSVD